MRNDRTHRRGWNALLALIFVTGTAAWGTPKRLDVFQKKRPAWVHQVPPTKEGRVSVIGLTSTARTLEEGREAALLNAAAQLSSRINLRISSRFLSDARSSRSEVRDEARGFTQASLKNLRTESFYWERWKEGSQATYHVWVWCTAPEQTLNDQTGEEKRAQALYDQAIKQWAGDVAGLLRRLKIESVDGRPSVEETTENPYGFGRVLLNDLEAQLVADGVRVSGEFAEARLTGTFRREGERVRVCARILDPLEEELRGTVRGEVPLAALSPEWLNLGTPVVEPLFAELEKRSAERPATGQLWIETTPPGARVYVDTEDKGTTNLTLHEVPVGPRAITLTLPGYMDYRDTVTIHRNDVTRLEITLEQATGILLLHTEPAGAAVYLDGQKTPSLTPTRLEKTIAGLHRLRLTHPDCRPFEGVIHVAPGETQTVRQTLELLEGRLLVRTDPEDATVSLLDGPNVIFVKQGETHSAQVPAGAHNLLVRREGYATVRQGVTIRPRETLSRTVLLKKELPKATPPPILPKRSRPIAEPEPESTYRTPRESFRAEAALQSAICPGWGQFTNGDDQKGWIVGGSFWLSVTMVVAFSSMADDDYELYQQSTNAVEADSYYESAKANDNAAVTLSWVALGLWAYGVVDAAAVQNRDGIFARVDPAQKSVQLAYQRRFP